VDSGECHGQLSVSRYRELTGYGLGETFHGVRVVEFHGHDIDP
jgi:hypothetical protein